jgi:hypothetical protein
MMMREGTKMTDLVMKNADGKEVALKDFLVALNKYVKEYQKKTFPSLYADGNYDVITAQVGRKYIKLVRERADASDSKSVYCFIDLAGNIYKAASWKAPAKHIRGTVFEPDYSIGKALGHYGAAYL